MNGHPSIAGGSGGRHLRIPEITASTAVAALAGWLAIEDTLIAAMTSPASTAIFGLMLAAVVGITLLRSAAQGLIAGGIASVVFAVALLIQVALRQLESAVVASSALIAALLLLTAVAFGQMVSVNLRRNRASTRTLPDGGSISRLPGREVGLRQLTTLLRSDLHTRRLCVAMVETNLSGGAWNAVERTIRENVGASALVFRYGPGRTIIALPGHPLDSARAVLEIISDSTERGRIRIATMAAEPGSVLEELLSELESGLDICQTMGLTMIDSDQLATR